MNQSYMWLFLNTWDSIGLQPVCILSGFSRDCDKINNL